MKTKYVMFFFMTLLLSCSQEENTGSADRERKTDTENDQSAVQTDMTGEVVDLNRVPDKISINPAVQSTHEFATGTKITIPENAFVDMKGNPVNQNVELEFDEFHSTGEIIASNIPMKYDSAGTMYDFESAGMFELRAFRDGEELALADGKTIDVELASFRSGSDFTFYHMPDRQGEWEYVGRGGQIPNRDRESGLRAVRDTMAGQKEPAKPLAYDPGGKYFDLNIDYDKFHSYKELMGLLWQYAGNDSMQDPYNRPEVYLRKWDYVSINPQDNGGIYEIRLANGDTSVTTNARPVYRGRVLEEASDEFNAQLKSFNRRMKQMKNMREQLERESTLLRTFAINKMGIYNYDRQYKYDNMIPLAANFDFGDEEVMNNPVSVFLVTGKGTAVVKYPPSQWELFRFNPDDKNVLVAILPDNSVATYSSRQFRSINTSALSTTEPNPYTFSMNLTDHKAKSPEALDRIIASL